MLDWSTRAMSSVRSRSAEKGCSDDEDSKISGDKQVPALLVEPLRLRGILPSVEFELKEAVSSGVKSKFWTAWEWMSPGGNRPSDVEVMESNSGLVSHELLARLEINSTGPWS